MSSETPDSRPRKVRVYTKTGDKGTSSLFNLSRMPKNDDHFHALGDVDELNAHLGVVRDHLRLVQEKLAAGQTSEGPSGLSIEHKRQILDRVSEQLIEIQSRLFDVGACVATPISTSTQQQLERVPFADNHTTFLEQWIDQHEEILPPIRHFVLPSGGLLTSHAHVARAVCRRAERRIVGLAYRNIDQGEAEKKEDSEEESKEKKRYPLLSPNESDVPLPVIRFMNRLSDYLYIISRVFAVVNEEKETIWLPQKPQKQ